MNSSLVLAEIDGEIARLQHARAVLSNSIGERGGLSAAPLKTATKKRKLSAKGRRAIAAAQRARWAKLKAAKKQQA